MVASDAALCNIALGLVGIRDTIDSLNEDSDQAAECRVHYAQVRDEVLRAGKWKFANQRKDLALLTLSRTGWGYVYAVPSDFIRDIRLWPPPTAGGGVFNGWPPPGGLATAGFNTTIRSLGSDQRVPYELMGDSSLPDGTYILATDLQFANLEYIRRVTNAAAFPTHFVTAVAYSLASKLALSLPVKQQLALGMDGKAEKALLAAVAIEANMGREDPEPESAFTRER